MTAAAHIILESQCARSLNSKNFSEEQKGCIEAKPIYEHSTVGVHIYNTAFDSKKIAVLKEKKRP